MDSCFLDILREYRDLGIDSQIDYNKFYLYSLVTHSTAIEGSTLTESENRVLFDDGIPARGHNLAECLMNLDLKNAYQHALSQAKDRIPLSVPILCDLSSRVMKNTGMVYNTALGAFDSSKGELRKLNVTAGYGDRSYLGFEKVPGYLEKFCIEYNDRIEKARSEGVMEQYSVSFDALFTLVSIHPWADGNGRMARLLMNYIQLGYGLLPVRIDKDDKNEYIAALNQSKDEESFEPFRKFMFEEHTKNLRKEIETYKLSTKSEPLIRERKGIGR